MNKLRVIHGITNDSRPTVELEFGGFSKLFVHGQAREDAIVKFEWLAHALREGAVPESPLPPVEVRAKAAENYLMQFAPKQIERLKDPMRPLRAGELDTQFDSNPTGPTIQELIERGDLSPASLEPGNIMYAGHPEPEGPTAEQRKAQWRFVAATLLLAQANLREGFERRMLDAAVVIAQANERA